jgi:hypothetical protein
VLDDLTARKPSLVDEDQSSMFPRCAPPARRDSEQVIVVCYKCTIQYGGAVEQSFVIKRRCTVLICIDYIDPTSAESLSHRAIHVSVQIERNRHARVARQRV